MDNKNIFIGKLIRDIFPLAGIIYLFFHSVGITKVVLIPFVICGIALVGKDICIVFGKKKAAVMLGKIFVAGFLVFWYGVVVFCSYLMIRDEKYPSLLFTVPFWLVSVWIMKRYFHK